MPQLMSNPAIRSGRTFNPDAGLYHGTLNLVRFTIRRLFAKTNLHISDF